MVSDRLIKSRMTEPGGVQNPILLARRAAVIDKYEGLKSSYPELPSYIFSSELLSLCVSEKKYYTPFSKLTHLSTL